MGVVRIKDDGKNPGYVPGPMSSLHGMGGSRNPAIPPKLMTLCIFVDLEASVYEAGGIPFLGKGSCIPGTQVFDVCQLGGYDPHGCGVVEPPKGLNFLLGNPDCPTEPTLVICDADGEVAPGYTLPGGCVWLKIGYTS